MIKIQFFKKGGIARPSEARRRGSGHISLTINALVARRLCKKNDK